MNPLLTIEDMSIKLWDKMKNVFYGMSQDELTFILNNLDVQEFASDALIQVISDTESKQKELKPHDNKNEKYQRID